MKLLLTFVACAAILVQWAAAQENLARGKATLQSSLDFGGLSSRAVDGNPDTDYHKGSCTCTKNEKEAWWAVDLGEAIRVKSVRIVNRKDCCQSRLSAFYIGVQAKSPDVLRPVPGTNECFFQSGMAPIEQTYTCKKPIVGRYVTIQLTNANYLTLCEVEVYGNKAPASALVDKVDSLNNIALKKVALQSTLDFGGSPERGVDGNLDTDFHKGSCTCTKNEKNAWWAVDLGSPARVRRVQIYNRQDCCPERLSDFYIGVQSKDPRANPPKPGENVCYYQKDKPDPANQIFSCDKPIVGRYVTVQLNGANYLTLCEVRVFGTLLKSQNSNLAEGKVALQSSLDLGGSPGRGVDGNPDTNYHKGSCTCTKNEKNAWWAVDLGKATRVASVIIFNRADCCPERLKDFTIGVQNDNPNSVKPDISKNVCYHHDGSANAGEGRYTCDKPMVGRYVTVQLAGANYLTLCEVQVFGKDLD